jgi:hypothetical protein
MGDQLQFIQLEVMVVALGLLVLLADLFLSESARRSLGYIAAGSLGLVFLLSFRGGYTDLAEGEAVLPVDGNLRAGVCGGLRLAVEERRVGVSRIYPVCVVRDDVRRVGQRLQFVVRRD